MFAERSQGQWKMVYYVGLPHFTADDVLWSIGSPAEPSQEVPQVSAPVCKTVLPIGITVIVRNTGRLIGITIHHIVQPQDANPDFHNGFCNT
ncbi:hypothetical protein YC2023_052458 [Brassica napus]